MELFLNRWDLAIIAIYVLGIALVVIRHMKGDGDTADFLLAGRKLTLPLFVGTLVSTWYGGIMGIAEFTGMAGVGAWLVQGLVWYFAYLLFAIFLAGRIREMPFYTIPDILAHRFGNKVAFLGGVFTYLMVNPAPYILSLGILLQLFFGVSLTTAVTVSAIFTVFYTLAAGFRGVVYTDALQCIGMYLAFIFLFAAAVGTWGGAGFPARKSQFCRRLHPASHAERRDVTVLHPGVGRDDMLDFRRPEFLSEMLRGALAANGASGYLDRDPAVGRVRHPVLRERPLCFRRPQRRTSRL